MAPRLPLDTDLDRHVTDHVFVHVLRLALRGVVVGEPAAMAIGAYDPEVLRRALHRFERLLDDEWSGTCERARAILCAAIDAPTMAQTA